MKTLLCIALLALLTACGGGGPEDDPQTEEYVGHDMTYVAPPDCSEPRRCE